MKFVFSVRSDMAFNLLKKLIHNEDYLSDVTIREQNAQTIQQLEDAIEFYKADLYIIDRQLEEYEALIKVLRQYNCEYIEIQNDVKAVMPEIRSKYANEEKEENNEEIYYEKNEKRKVIIQEKIIEKEVIRETYKAIPSKVIVVGSLYKGAGSTILATNLARMIAERGIDVSYVEHPLIKPYMFDYLQIHTQEQEYYDIAREIQTDGLARSKRDEWNQFDVKWHVIDSRKPPLQSFTYENLLVLSHTIQSNVLIVDISDRWLDPEIQKYLYIADFIYLCVEADPIKYDWSLYNHHGDNHKEKKIMDFLNLEQKISRYDLVNMKYIKGIDVKAWNEMLHRKPLAKLPYIPYEDIQKNIYKSKLLYDSNYRDIFEENLLPLIVKVIPKDFIDIKRKEPLSFKRLFKKY
ncbi:hypothetical protein MKX83_24270 [Cytobacillus sp. FSL M8-0252]|uniref:hypothetical protein n=1 Tax=Cytobacillus sp. FSL M8-0252 TaxID=2921621 RepID=UPI0030F851F7